MQLMTWERQRAYDLDAGREEGIEIGAQQKAEETAENMMKKNYPVDDICKITGFSLEQVLKIKDRISRINSSLKSKKNPLL